MPTLWAGIDAGKRTHHCVVIDSDGAILLSTKVSNDETELLDLIATVIALDSVGEVCWATDLTDGGAALLIALLAAHGQQLLYIPGRIVHHASATYRGDGKTDAKDARIIADQARMRTDLQPVRIATDIALGLRLLTSHRLDVIHDRVRAINRLRATMLEYFPALERAFDYSKSKAALVLLSHYATPESLRRIGVARLAAWLKARGCRNSSGVAKTAVDAAHEQTTALPALSVGSALVTKLAATIIAIDEDLAGIDAEITKRLAQHQSAANLLSMPGFGAVLAATFLAQIGGGPSTPSRTSTDSPASPGSRPSHATPDASAGTCTDPAGSTVACCGPAISPPYRASRTAQRRECSTTASAPRASHTSKRSSLSLGDA